MKRLGYTRYVAQGGDWGAFVVDLMGVQALTHRGSGRGNGRVLNTWAARACPARRVALLILVRACVSRTIIIRNLVIGVVDAVVRYIDSIQCQVRFRFVGTVVSVFEWVEILMPHKDALQFLLSEMLTNRYDEPVT